MIWNLLVQWMLGAPFLPRLSSKSGKAQTLTVRPFLIAATALLLLAPLAVSAQPHFNGAKALDYAREFVAIGPRWPTGPGHVKAEQFLRTHFQHDQVEEDAFTANTPIGAIC